MQDEDDAIEIFKRDAQGGNAPIAKVMLKGWPKRPKGTTKVEISIVPTTSGDFGITVKDMGFGEIFASSGKIASAVARL